MGLCEPSEGPQSETGTVTDSRRERRRERRCTTRCEAGGVGGVMSLTARYVPRVPVVWWRLVPRARALQVFRLRLARLLLRLAPVRRTDRALDVLRHRQHHVFTTRSTDHLHANR